MKIIPTGKWTFASDRDSWINPSYTKKEYAISDGKFCIKNRHFFVGQIYNVEFEFCDVQRYGEKIIENLLDALYDYCGDNAESWYNNISYKYTDELDDLIAKTVLQWIEGKDIRPSCYTISDIEEINADSVKEKIFEKSNIELAPMVHAKWIDKGDYMTTAYGSLDIYQCSNCKEYITINEHDKFCPNCGAKMDLNELEVSKNEGV